MSLNFLLAVYTVFLIVTKENAPRFTSNKLTMRPYYLTLTYTAAFTIQMLFAILLETHTLYVLNMVNLVKLCLQNAAVAVQAYEWFALYKMIAFQANHDMTTVEVERRKFKPIEIRHRLIYKMAVWTVFSLSFASMLVIEMH